MLQASSARGYTVHGRQLSADMTGHTHFKFHAGQTWVRDISQMMTFLSPGIEKMTCNALIVFKGIRR